MGDDMGTFRVDIELENPARPGQRLVLRSVLVDTGAELSSLEGLNLRVDPVNKRLVDAGPAPAAYAPLPPPPPPRGRLGNPRAGRGGPVAAAPRGHLERPEDQLGEVHAPGVEEGGQQGVGAPAGAADRPADAQPAHQLAPSGPAPVGAPAAEPPAADRAAGASRKLRADPLLKCRLDLGFRNAYDQQCDSLSLARGPLISKSGAPRRFYFSEGRSLPLRASPRPRRSASSYVVGSATGAFTGMRRKTRGGTLPMLSVNDAGGSVGDQTECRSTPAWLTWGCL